MNSLPFMLTSSVLVKKTGSELQGDVHGRITKFGISLCGAQ